MKTRTRFLSVLLAALLLLAALPINGFALEEGGPGVMLESKGELGGETLESIAVTFGAKGDYDNGDLYGQLTTRQKACYDALEAITIDQILSAPSVQSGGKVFHRMRVNVAGITGLSLQGAFSGGKFEPAQSSQNDVSDIYTDLCAAIVALRYDRPDYLWIGYLYYGYWVSQAPGAAARVTDVVFDFYLEYEGREKAMWEEMMKNAETIAGEAAKETDTYRKVLSVHDQLAAGNAYGDTNDLTAHSPYSALVTGDRHQPVCDGYSKAFKIVLDLLEIPCATASSATHMWNNVRMDDGDWYNIDLTWDDNSDELVHDYFLIGSQTVVRGKPFSQQTEHIEENPYAAYRAESRNDLLKPLTFLFPTKNKNAYVDTEGDYAPLRFPDVKRSQWCYSHVENAVSLGLFSGDTNGRFRPSDNITRAEFASVVAKSLGVDVSAYQGASFSDVSQNRWYAPAVAWAKASGLMSGDGGNTFRPDDPITRQEMCVVLRNATQTRATGSHTFPDDAQIAHWAKDAVYECYAKGYLSGDENGNFAPRDNTQRSQAAVVCSRFAVQDGALKTPAGTEPELPEEGESEEEQ